MSPDRSFYPLTQRLTRMGRSLFTAVGATLGAAALLLSVGAHATQRVQAAEPADVCPALRHMVSASSFSQLHDGGLNGCAWTLITAADATGSVIQAGYAIASNYSSPTFVNGRSASISAVCIEVNQMVSVGDFVPSLPLALNRRGIRPDVYNPGTSPASCEARLLYNASVDYGRREFNDNPVQYLSVIDLTLLQQGHILVTARYQTGELSLDRFSNASVKLSGMIDKMVVNRLQLRPQRIQTSQAN